MPRNSAVTIALIAVCALVALLSGLGASQAVLQTLYIASPGSHGFEDIANGQAWRLVTPIFIHFGILHIVFNLMWIWDLGRMMEAIKGAVFHAIRRHAIALLRRHVRRHLWLAGLRVDAVALPAWAGV